MASELFLLPATPLPAGVVPNRRHLLARFLLSSPPAVLAAWRGRCVTGECEEAHGAYGSYAGREEREGFCGGDAER